MDDAFRLEFAKFAKEKLQPAVAVIPEKKRSGIIRSAGIGLGCFLVGAAAVYMFLSPYREAMNTTGMSLWPLMVLAPAALAVLVFSLVFVLYLRKTVVDFRNAFVAGLANFIDPGLAFENDNRMPQDTIQAGHLFTDGQKVSVGSERFRGRSGDAVTEFSNICTNDGTAGNRRQKGLYLVAHYDRPFPHPFFIFPANANVSISGLETALAQDGYQMNGGLVRVEHGGRQFLIPSGEEGGAGLKLSRELADRLNDLQGKDGAELYISGRENDMYLALLSPGGEKDTAGIFDNFDFDACREFCYDARMAMRLAKQGGERRELLAESSLS